MNFIVQAFLSYIQKHPEVLEKIIEKLLEELIKKIDGDPTT